MIAADVGRGLALGTIPAAYAADVLTIWQLFAVGVVTGTCTVFFEVASQSLLPLVLPRSKLPDGNASLQMSVQGAQLVGPGFGGALVGLLGAPFAVIADAASFIGSAVLVKRLRHTESARPGRRERTMARELREGLRYVLGHPIMRPNLAYLVTANCFNYIFLSFLLLFAVRQLGLSTGEVGLTLSLANIGSLAGAILTPRLQRRVGLGRVMLLTAFGGCGLLLIPFASGAATIPLLAGGLFLWGAGVVVYQATSVSLLQATTPDHLMARMTATRRFVARSTIPLWMLLGGLLGTYLGLRTTLMIGAGGRAVAGLILLASPVRSIRSLEDAEVLVRDYNRRVTDPVHGDPAGAR